LGSLWWCTEVESLLWVSCGRQKLTWMPLPFFLINGAPLARAFGPRGAPLQMKPRSDIHI